MKRYKINTTVQKTQSPVDLNVNLRALSVVEESESGEWVKWSDVEALREHLEAQIPNLRIAKLERALGLVHSGKCPECEQRVHDYQAPVGCLAPEAFATLRERGIDPLTGHRATCPLNRR